MSNENNVVGSPADSSAPNRATREFIGLLDRKLEEILGCPTGWGGIEALEPLVLTLLMLRATIADPGADERAILRGYRRFLADRVGPGAADLRTRLGAAATEATMTEIMRDYANTQRTPAPDLQAAQLPEPPIQRGIGGDAVDITRPHYVPRRAS